MNYIEVTIFTSSQGIEHVTASLLKLGIEETIVENPEDIEAFLQKKNSEDWDYVDEGVVKARDGEPKVIAYLEDNEAGRKQLSAIKLEMMKLKSLEMEGIFGWDIDLGRLYTGENVVSDEDWKDKWKDYFKPTKVSQTIVIKPTWEDYSQKDGEKIIEMDPGQAFGTGAHETTSMCIRLMEEHGCEGKKVLDVGCGSGVLSIAAVRLGSRDVLAVDIDKTALDVANSNVKLNDCEGEVKVMHNDLTAGIDFAADIVLANLTADLVIKLSAEIESILSSGGIFIASGIIAEKKEQALAAVEANGMSICGLMQEGEWCAFAAERK